MTPPPGAVRLAWGRRCAREAAAACASFFEAREDLGGWLADCPSGVELRQRGHPGGVEAAAAPDAGDAAAVWRDGRFLAAG